jgi:60 kDa SS-A/Ro ribonucleoprotein
MPDPLATINLRRTPQSEQADPRQVTNHAGGYVFAVDPMTQLRRFLVLGTTGGTYYAGQRELTQENAGVVLDLARTRGVEVVAEVVKISAEGRAPKNDQAIFALAAVLGVGDVEAKRAADVALPLVVRTGTHLFQFTSYLEQFRGWGPVARRAVSRWYEGKDAEALAYQVVKYRSRNDWTHRDVLRSAHPRVGSDLAKRAVMDFACGRPTTEGTPAIIDGFRAAQTADSPAETARLVEHFGLSWEMLRTEHLTESVVWEALLTRGLPVTALVRQLSRLTNLGMLGPSSPWTRLVAAQLSDSARLRKGRVHPITLLIALRTYAQGHGEDGRSTWAPTPAIVDALDAGFYASFDGVEATGKRRRLALDVSGSMGMSRISGLPITPREASAALAMVAAATEPCDVVGFTDGSRADHQWHHGELSPLGISPRRRLDDNVRAVSELSFGGTDCALPITDALARGLEFDSFEVYTDNETWQGPVHVHQALRTYRERVNPDARLVVIAMTATEFSVADPADAGSLDVVGFDSATPTVVADFVRGVV